MDSARLQYFLESTLSLKRTLNYHGRIELRIEGMELSKNPEGLQFLEFSSVGITNDSILRFYAPPNEIPDIKKTLKLLAFGMLKPNFIKTNQLKYSSFNKNENRREHYSLLPRAKSNLINWHINPQVNKLMAQQSQIYRNEFFDICAVNNSWKVILANDSVEYYRDISNYLRINKDEFLLFYNKTNFKYYRNNIVQGIYKNGFSFSNLYFESDKNDTIRFSSVPCFSSEHFILPKDGDSLYVRYSGHITGVILQMILENELGRKLSDNERSKKEFWEDATLKDSIFNTSAIADMIEQNKDLPSFNSNKQSRESGKKPKRIYWLLMLVIVSLITGLLFFYKYYKKL